MWVFQNPFETLGVVICLLIVIYLACRVATAGVLRTYKESKKEEKKTDG